MPVGENVTESQNKISIGGVEPKQCIGDTRRTEKI